EAVEHLHPNLCLLERIMLEDVKFWKSVRVQWHQLFMSGLLLDIDIKRQFARLFTKNYQQLLLDYTKDDHEHRVSVMALTVQIFTVPSVAQMLIEEEN